jgi:hypothetical protein
LVGSGAPASNEWRRQLAYAEVIRLDFAPVSPSQRRAVSPLMFAVLYLEVLNFFEDRVGCRLLDTNSRPRRHLELRSAPQPRVRSYVILSVEAGEGGMAPGDAIIDDRLKQQPRGLCNTIRNVFMQQNFSESLLAVVCRDHELLPHLVTDAWTFCHDLQVFR